MRVRAHVRVCVHVRVRGVRVGGCVGAWVNMGGWVLGCVGRWVSGCVRMRACEGVRVGG